MIPMSGPATISTLAPDWRNSSAGIFPSLDQLFADLSLSHDPEADVGQAFPVARKNVYKRSPVSWLAISTGDRIGVNSWRIVASLVIAARSCRGAAWCCFESIPA